MPGCGHIECLGINCDETDGPETDRALDIARDESALGNWRAEHAREAERDYDERLLGGGLR